MDNYLFQAAPKPVQTRTKKNIYRDRDEQKESDKTQNLMYDRRVARGSTYAPSKRTQPLPQTNFRPLPVANGPQRAAAGGLSHTRAADHRGAKDQQHPLPPSSAAPPNEGDVDFIRIATPEPVAGRTHCTVQTDTYLEDLRRDRKALEHDFSTQTDPENDRPTQPLFVPRSSGDDVATEIDEGALFDFELEVQSVLGVLVEKTLEQSLMEVCEEEELAELAVHRAEFDQAKNLALVGVQQLVQRDERRKAERERRAEQEAARLAEEKKLSERRAAALLSKRMVAAMEEAVIEKLDKAGYFYDPVRKEVETRFMPDLLQATADKIAQYQASCNALDNMLLDGINQYQKDVEAHFLEEEEQEVKDLVAYKLDPQNVKKPVKSVMSLVNKAGKSEEKSAHATFQPAPRQDEENKEEEKAPPEERAQAIVDKILAEREAIRLAEEKRMRDIVIIQSLARGNRDRARVAKLMEIRRREAERAAMSPAELLVSLRNYIGMEVEFSPASAAAADGSSSSSSSAGAVVISLAAQGPASQGGLVKGDRIVAVQGHPISSADDLAPSAIKSLGVNPGDALTLSVVRATTDGRLDNIRIEVGSDEPNYDQAAVRDLRAQAELPESTLPWYSASEALEILSKLAAKLGGNVTEVEGGGGAKFKTVSADSAAARAGLKEGDIVVSLNGSHLGDSKEFTSALKEMVAGEVIEVEVLTPASKEKVAAGARIDLRKMTTQKVKVELGGGGKKLSIEAVRALRRIAKKQVFNEA